MAVNIGARFINVEAVLAPNRNTPWIMSRVQLARRQCRQTRSN